MTTKTAFKTSISRVLSYANAQIESLSLQRMEEVRPRKIKASAYFDCLPFPIPHCFEQMRSGAIFEQIQSCEQRVRSFDEARRTRRVSVLRMAISRHRMLAAAYNDQRGNEERLIPPRGEAL